MFAKASTPDQLALRAHQSKALQNLPSPQPQYKLIQAIINTPNLPIQGTFSVFGFSPDVLRTRYQNRIFLVMREEFVMLPLTLGKAELIVDRHGVDVCELKRK